MQVANDDKTDRDICTHIGVDDYVLGINFCMSDATIFFFYFFLKKFLSRVYLDCLCFDQVRSYTESIWVALHTYCLQAAASLSFSFFLVIKYCFR